MKLTNTRLPARQRGAFYATVILLVLVGAVLTATLKIVPAYNDDNMVQQAMDSVLGHPDYKTMSIADIRREILRSLRVNNVENFDAENVKLVRDSGKDYVDITYETRIPMVANIFAVVVFSRRYDKF